MGTRMHWPFEDPAAFEGPEEEKLQVFRKVRDQIKTRIQEWIAEKNN
jgi:arsenate reductase